MKYLLTAAMLVIAAPAAAQTAPAPAQQGHDQHQGHAQHQGHGQHQQQTPAQPGQPQGGQQQQRDCCADRNGNGRMDCCEGMAAPAPAARPQG